MNSELFDKFKLYAIKYASSFYSKNLEQIFVGSGIGREDFIQESLLYLLKFIKKLKSGHFNSADRKVKFSDNPTDEEINKLVGNALHYEFLHIKRDAAKFKKRYSELQLYASKIGKKLDDIAYEEYYCIERTLNNLDRNEIFLSRVLPEEEKKDFYDKVLNKGYKRLDVKQTAAKIKKSLKKGGNDESVETRTAKLFGYYPSIGRN